MVVEAALACFEIQDRTGEAGVAGEEPLAPFGFSGECPMR